jgi:hypothetical protein
MGQQPNIEISDSEKPRQTLQPPAAARWRPDKPGMITAPDQVPSGGAFGYPGPDAGWAYRVIAAVGLPDPQPALRHVVAALMTARASALGRGPVREDLEVALLVCGYGPDADESLVERRLRWLRAVSHDGRPGETAVAEVDPDLLINKPDKVRYVLSHQTVAKGSLADS